jgi:hypothetical protein
MIKPTVNSLLHMTFFLPISHPSTATERTYSRLCAAALFPFHLSSQPNCIMATFHIAIRVPAASGGSRFPPALKERHMIAAISDSKGGDSSFLMVIRSDCLGADFAFEGR